MRMNKGAVQPLLPAMMATDAPAQRHCASRGPRHHLVSGDDPPTSLAPPDTSRPCPAEEAIMKQDAFVARTRIVCGSRDYSSSPFFGKAMEDAITDTHQCRHMDTHQCRHVSGDHYRNAAATVLMVVAGTRTHQEVDPGFCAHVQHLMGFTLSVLLAERLRGREIGATPTNNNLAHPGGNGRLESREQQ